MNLAVDKKYNLKNLKDMSSHLEDIEYFIFFGTLLGYHRNNDIIEWDDDIDFYVNINHKNDIINILVTLNLDISIDHPYFVQGTRVIDNIRTYVDFYFYENSPDKDYILERWNFHGQSDNEVSHLHIPKNYIYPISEGKMGNIDFKVPNNIESCCKFLYGEKYNFPLKKGIDYVISCNNNKPVIIYRNGV